MTKHSLYGILYMLQSEHIQNWDGDFMTNEALSEKVSVNINAATLSSIDLLVDSGYYSNRSDFINQALRASLQQHSSTIDRLVAQNTERSEENGWFLGIYGITRRSLQEDFQQEKRYALKGYGILSIDTDCPEEQLFAVYESIQVKGKIFCAPAVKAHYGFK